MDPTEKEIHQDCTLLNAIKKFADLLSQNPADLPLEYEIKPLIRDLLHGEDLDDPFLLLLFFDFLLILAGGLGLNLRLPQLTQVIQRIELWALPTLPCTFLRRQDTYWRFRTRSQAEVLWIWVGRRGGEKRDV